jgi:hypothetical protein
MVRRPSPCRIEVDFYEARKSTFVALGERPGPSPFHAALHFHSPEFFMTSDDPRKQPLHERLLPCEIDAVLDFPGRRHKFPFLVAYSGP